MSQEVLDAITALAVETRAGLDSIRDEVRDLRAHVLEQDDRAGRRVGQIENAVSSISKRMAREATQEAHA